MLDLQEQIKLKCNIAHSPSSRAYRNVRSTEEYMPFWIFFLIRQTILVRFGLDKHLHTTYTTLLNISDKSGPKAIELMERPLICCSRLPSRVKRGKEVQDKMPILTML